MLAGFQMAADIGAIIGPVVAGALAERVGYAAAFGVTGAVRCWSACWFWVRAPETLPGRPSTAAADAVATCAPDECASPGYPEARRR